MMAALNPMTPLARREWTWMLFRGLILTALHRLAAALRGENNQLVEIHDSMFSIGWGVWFLLPWYDNSSKYPLFHVMMWVLTPEFWAVMFIGTGCFRLLSIVSNRDGLRRNASFCAFLLWLFTATFLTVGEWRAICCPTAWLMALWSGFAYLKISATIRRSTRSPHHVHAI